MFVICHTRYQQCYVICHALVPLLHPEHQYLKSLQQGVKLNQQVTLEVQVGGQKGHVQNKYNSWAFCDCSTNKINIILKPSSH